MTRPRGRPVAGEGLSRELIVDAALQLLEDGDGQGLSMRALAGRLGIAPMSLYHHVGDHVGLLRAVSDRIHADVLQAMAGRAPPATRIRRLLTHYHAAVGRHPQLTLALFTSPRAIEGAARQVTEGLDALLATITPDVRLWRDILIDHAHGSGLASSASRGNAVQARRLQRQYRQALDRLMHHLQTGGGHGAQGEA